MFKKIARAVSDASARRMLLGLIANAAGKGWVLLLQLLAIPVYSKAWGASGYGTWLMLSTVPTYVALGGLGFGNAAATEMTRRRATSDVSGALTAFQSVWALITAVVGVLAIIASLLWAVIRWTHGLESSTSLHTSDAAIILVWYSFFAVQTSLVHTGYRSSGRYALGTTLMDLIGFAEGFAAITSAALGGDFVLAAMAMLTIRALGLAAFYLELIHIEPWLRIGISSADLRTVKRLAKPASASLALAASNALALQGIVVALGAFISPIAVATYSTTRTLCRIPLQLSDLVSRATLPELTTAHATSDFDRFDRITLMNVGSALGLALPFFLALGLFGPGIGRFVSGGNLHFDRYVFVFVLIATGCQVLWMALAQSLQATNRHHVVSFPYVLLTAVGAATPALLGHVRDPLLWVSISVAATEIVMALLSVRSWLAERARDRRPSTDMLIARAK